ncbi:MAG: malto-oligosyltrehalose trehalohydrolase [Gemmatimonadaceae bacterium]|nr:malto-oligosyltrehalose trehalohydrolase [Gemmatimonadaceae bacterium]
MSGAWSLERGACVNRAGTRFSVWAPKAKRVEVVIEGEDTRSVVLEAREGGAFEGRVPGVGAGTDYRFRLDGGEPRPDPVSRWQPEGVHGPSRVVDPAAFRWSDAGWRGLAMADYVIYELHVGTFTAEGTFDAAIARLGELKASGVTAIEIMPVAEFPGARNWGYDGVSLYAPHSAYGGPEGLRRLVDAAHGAGLAVVLDVVYNHVGPEGNYLPLYGPYFTETYKTPWGPAVNYDGADSPEVRRFVIENALYWVTEYHVDALRLDAIHGIYDFGAKHVLAELVERVHAQGEALGRNVVVIAESDLNDPKVVRPPEVGGYGFDAQWSDDFHHAVHALLTEEDKGYYADFGGVEPLATAIAERFHYAGRYSRHRRRHHGAPSHDVSGDHFVIAIQNHDQVGNRAAGERLSALVSFPRQKLAAALLLLSPYIPLIFMGEEYGETNPFQYFVSHGDAQLVESVRAGRKKEFEAFGWGDEVPDPQSEETFQRSKLDWTSRERSPHRELRALYRDLLALRRREPALRPGGPAPVVAFDAERGWMAVELSVASRQSPATAAKAVTDNRQPATGNLLALYNLSDREQGIPIPSGGLVTALLSTTDTPYQPPGAASTQRRHDAAGDVVTLPPYAAVVFRREQR